MEQIIQKFGKSDPFKVFESVKTYDDLIKANVAFLQGRVIAAPYHPGPVDEETIPLLGNLIKINSMGFVSIEGQPASCVYGMYAPKTQLYLDVEQKSYIIGILQKKYLSDFIDFFKNENFYYILGDGYGIIKNTLPGKAYNVSREKSSRNKNDLNDQEWYLYTNISHYSVSHNENELGFNKKILDDTFSIALCSSQYCKNSVENILLKFLKYAKKSEKDKINNIEKIIQKTKLK